MHRFYLAHAATHNSARPRNLASFALFPLSDSMNFALKVDETCIQVDGICIKIDGFCIENAPPCQVINSFQEKNLDFQEKNLDCQGNNLHFLPKNGSLFNKTDRFHRDASIPIDLDPDRGKFLLPSELAQNPSFSVQNTSFSVQNRSFLLQNPPFSVHNCGPGTAQHRSASVSWRTTVTKINIFQGKYRDFQQAIIILQWKIGSFSSQESSFSIEESSIMYTTHHCKLDLALLYEIHHFQYKIHHFKCKFHHFKCKMHHF